MVVIKTDKLATPRADRRAAAHRRRPLAQQLNFSSVKRLMWRKRNVCQPIHWRWHLAVSTTAPRQCGPYHVTRHVLHDTTRHRTVINSPSWHVERECRIYINRPWIGSSPVAITRGLNLFSGWWRPQAAERTSFSLPSSLVPSFSLEDHGPSWRSWWVSANCCSAPGCIPDPQCLPLLVFPRTVGHCCAVGSSNWHRSSQPTGPWPRLPPPPPRRPSPLGSLLRLVPRYQRNKRRATRRHRHGQAKEGEINKEKRGSVRQAERSWRERDRERDIRLRPLR